MPYSLDRRRRRNVFLGTSALFMDVITESHNTRWELPDFVWVQNRKRPCAFHTHTHHTHRNPPGWVGCEFREDI